MSMRHLHIPSFPGRHRSGFFFILLLFFLETELGNLGTEEGLMAAMETYFAEHPHFHPWDHNERRVRKLIKTHVDIPWSMVEGPNYHELPCLIGAMDDEPLYQHFLAEMRDKEQRERSRSPRPSGYPKAKKKPKALAEKSAASSSHNSEVAGPQSAASSSHNPKAKKMPKAIANSEVAGPQSEAASSDSPRFEVPGPESTDTSSDLPWELDTHEWVHRDCWACPDCNSFNLRFTQWCVCGTQRESFQDKKSGDWDCPVCGNLVFGWRRWCPWSDCPSGDWTCPKCGNHNWARRKACNSRSCQHPRPW